MADIKGIELASEIYDLEDTSARNTATQAGQTATQASQTATQADEKIGDLSNLATTVKTDVVSAINEVLSESGGATTSNTIIRVARRTVTLSSDRFQSWSMGKLNVPTGYNFQYAIPFVKAPYQKAAYANGYNITDTADLMYLVNDSQESFEVDLIMVRIFIKS